jgi:tyrosyl-tRNA synthetase
MKSADEQLDLLVRGCETVVTRKELKKKLEHNRSLRVKLGCDPTAPDLHLGHSVVLRKLRQFQDLGHKAVLIIGDYTALVGDPTGQNKTRPMLSDADIERNAKTYFEQAGKILDTAPDKLEIRRNGEWLAGMSFADVIRLTSKMTVARMLERDTFEKRHKAGEPISVHEFLYPLMQGHDSVMIRSDVELGGTDQTFNNLVGRDLQRDAGQEPQVVMILPILEGLDGVEKMSKSKGNYIGLNDPPKEMFRKVMKISDDLMWRWYSLLCGLTSESLTEIKKRNPRESKLDLARRIVAWYHDQETADREVDEYKKFTTGDRMSLKEIAAIRTVSPGTYRIIDLLKQLYVFKTSSEVYRLVRGGAVTIEGQKVTDDKAMITVKEGQLIKVSDKILVKLKLS